VTQMRERGISSLSRAARYTGLARHGLYYQPRPNSPRRPRPDEGRARVAVRRVALNLVTYGHRRVWAMLRREGWAINRKRVHRLMRVEGLLRPAHFPRPRLPLTGVLTATWPNEKWYTDLTYVDTTDRGPCPLTSILDGCTRKVVAWSFLPNCGAEEALEVLVAAVTKEFPEDLRADGVVLRSDAGSQFIAHRFREGAKILGIQVEAIRKKRPEDNGMIESYHGHLKADYLWVREPTSFVETRELLAEALRHYNEERPHSSLDYLTPIEYEKKKQEEAKA
jgi:putative transposase